MSEAMSPATQQQIDYIKRLCVAKGLNDLQAALLVEKTSLDELTKHEASRLINKMTAGAGAQGAEKPKSKFPTPLAMRRKAEAGEPCPADYDEHARWCFEHLRLALTVLSAIPAIHRPNTPKRDTNRGGDIKMSDLVSFFGSWDELAKAFDVTVPTAKSWGDILPSSRAYEAEVKTEGYVTAPRRK